jgi:hypothetical protein
VSFLNLSTSELMSTMISSPTNNLFDLLKDDAKSNKAKQANAKATTPGKRVPTPEERARARQEEDAQRNEQKKLEAALASQHEEEAVAEGFLVASATSGKDKQNSSKLSRTECIFYYFFCLATLSLAISKLSRGS